MRLYISSVFESHVPFERKLELCKGVHILHSFAYYKPQWDPLFEVCKTVLVDSGAFTVMTKALKGKLSSFDFMAYTKKYANFIKKYNLDNFIELDVEGASGFQTYKDCLHCLQDITGKDPIYVYHKWRGIEYYKELVKRHKWVALGDVDVLTRNTGQEDYFPWMVNYAHKYGCRVNGLAFTKLKDLEWIPFDSVDSSTWTSISRFATVHDFNGHNLWKTDCKRSKNGALISDSAKLMEYSLKQWVQLSKYYDREYMPIW